jgi:hypothetical protein
VKFTLIGGNKWVRINGSKKTVEQPTNKEFTKDGRFIQACETAGVPATSRQASKFRNKKGKAYNQ